MMMDDLLGDRGFWTLYSRIIDWPTDPPLSGTCTWLLPALFHCEVWGLSGWTGIGSFSPGSLPHASWARAFFWKQQTTGNHNRNVSLVVITRISELVPYHLVKSLQLIWRLDTCRFNLRLPNLQVSCSDSTRIGCETSYPNDDTDMVSSWNFEVVSLVITQEPMS